MKSRRFLLTQASPLLLPVVLLAFWWATSQNSTSIYYPPLEEILITLREDWWSARLVEDLLPSLACLLGALGIAAVAGVVFGAVIGISNLLYKAMLPILDVLRSCPGVALVPVSLAIFGIGSRSEVAVIAFATVWPILLNVVDGVRLSRENYRDVRTNLRMSYVQSLRYVDLPAARPQFMAGLYTSLSIGIVVMIASEYYSSTRGVGFYISNAEQTFAITKTYVGVVLLGVTGYVLSTAFRRLEHVVLRWRVGVR
jgi:sulfonate transport system permease protein